MVLSNFILTPSHSHYQAADSIVNITSKLEAKVLKQKLSQWNKQAHFQKRVRVFLRHLFWRQYISNVKKQERLFNNV